MPSLNVVLEKPGPGNGGGWIFVGKTNSPRPSCPPSGEKTTVCVTQHMPLLPGNWSTVVHTTPEGATCGSRSVLLCFESRTGSNRGVVQSECVPSGSALAVE